MYTFRYFMQDLHYALLEKHRIFREYGDLVEVYRGLRLTQSEFDDLTKSQEQLISMNGYLSTSLTRNVAEIYAGVPTATSDKISVVLEIECDIAQLGDTVIFGDVSSESMFPDENEILFDIGATFQLRCPPAKTESGIWYLKMRLTDEGRSIVRDYINDYLELNDFDSPKIMYGDLLYSLGKYDSCLSYFKKLLLNFEDENEVSIHLQIASVLGIQGDKFNEWRHYDIAYKLVTEAEPKRFYDEGLVLLQMSNFCSDSNNIDKALGYLEDFFHLYAQAPDDLISELPRAFLIMAGCYEKQENVDRAIECYQKGLKLYEECSASNHVLRCKLLLAMGNNYRVQCKYEDALVRFQEALDIRKRMLPEQHSEIADCLSFIGKILGDMNQHGEALIYSLHALEMYNKTLPANQLNERSSVLVDIGLCFSQVDGFQIALKYFHRALEMKTHSLNHDHPDFAVIFDHMAFCYTFLNRHLVALRYALKALNFYKRTRPLNRLCIAESCKTLAMIYSNMGCHSRALQKLKRAQRVLCNSDMQNHPKYMFQKRSIARLERIFTKRKKSRSRRRFRYPWDLKRCYSINCLSTK